MKSCGQQKKRKATQTLKENNGKTCSMHKKSAGRNCKPLQEAAGKLKSFSAGSAANSSGQEVLDQEKPLTRTAEVEKVKVETRRSLSPAKIKLQLFPVNESTRLRLEKDGHNPFLELTLSARKKISSVIKHLNTKWGNSGEGPGELMLFPFNTKWERVGSCRRWTSDDSAITAGELCAALDFPAVFRLRYGWLSRLGVEASAVSGAYVASKSTSGSKNGIKAGNLFSLFMGDCSEKFKLNTQEISNPINVHAAADVIASEQRPCAVPAGNMANDLMTHGVPTTSIASWDDSFMGLSIGGLLSEASLLDKIDKSTINLQNKLGSQPVLGSDVSMGGFLSEAIFKDDKINDSALNSLQPTIDSSVAQSAWDDCLTTLSIGGLLSEASLLERINPKPEGTTSNLKNQIPTINSFNGFVPAHGNSHPQIPESPILNSSSSILDGEVTCHAFAFQNLNTPSVRDLDSADRIDISEGSQGDKENLINSLSHHDESSLGIKGIKWNDSRGPFDLGLPMLQPVSGGDSVSRFFK